MKKLVVDNGTPMTYLMHMASKYAAVKPFNCTECGIELARNEVSAESQRTVVSSRNANKKVGPVARLCNDCNAAGEWKQELYRCELQAKMISGMMADRGVEWAAEMISDEPEWRQKIILQKAGC